MFYQFCRQSICSICSVCNRSVSNDCIVSNVSSDVSIVSNVSIVDDDIKKKKKKEFFSVLEWAPFALVGLTLTWFTWIENSTSHYLLIVNSVEM